MGARTITALWVASGGSASDMIYHSRTTYEIRFYLNRFIRLEDAQPRKFIQLLEEKVARIVASPQYEAQWHRIDDRIARKLERESVKKKREFEKDLVNPKSQLSKWAATLDPELAAQWATFLHAPNPWENGMYVLVILIGANELIRNCKNVMDVTAFRKTLSRNLDHGSDWMSKEVYGVLSGSSNQMATACEMATDILRRRSPQAA